jgi:peptide/nickel transport system substrate-binding protein
MLKRLNKIVIAVAVLFIAVSVSVSVYSAQEASALRVVVDVNLAHNNYGLRSSETESEYTITSHIYDTLLEMDSNGKIRAGLATKWEMIDPLTVRLSLREGVTFHNGEAFDANAVKFSIEHFNDKNMFTTAMLQPISEVVILGPHSVDVKLSRPDGSIFRKLAIWVKIFPPKYISKIGVTNFEKKPVGTGPFTIDSIVPGKKLVLRKNPRYWRKDYPSVERVEFYYVEDPKERLKWVTDGGAHIITNMESRDVIEIAKTNRYDVIKHPAFFVVFGIFNLEKAATPLKDVRVRKAINYSINREVLERLILRGNGRIVASLTMPNEIGHDASLNPYGYKLTLAKQMMKQAGYEKGFSLHIGLQPGLSRNSYYYKFIR